MAATTVQMNYIWLDEHGTARVGGSEIMVRILAEELRSGYRPEDIQAAHNELSMAEVYAALAYYYANKADFDEAIDRGAGVTSESQQGTADAEQADEHEWTAAFAATKDALLRAAAEARTQRKQGKTLPLETILDKQS